MAGYRVNFNFLFQEYLAASIFRVAKAMDCVPLKDYENQKSE
jgi:hypothetical protein